MVRSTARNLLPVLVTGLLVLGCAGDDSAPEPDSGSQAPQQQSPSGQQPSAQSPDQQTAPLDQESQFSDAQIEAAGRVYAQIQEAQQELQGGDQSSQNAAKQMQQSMQEAVSQEDELSGQQFQQLMKQIQQDPQLRKTFLQALEEAGGQIPQAQGPGGQ